MNKYAFDELLIAIKNHPNIHTEITLRSAMRVINGDLMFLQDAIINGDTILCTGHDLPQLFNVAANYYKVKPNYEAITFLGVEIPKPLTKNPTLETRYYYRNGMGIVECGHWDNHSVDKRRFKYGIWTDEKHAEIATELINKTMEINHEN